MRNTQSSSPEEVLKGSLPSPFGLLNKRDSTEISDKEPKKGKSALDAVSTHLCFLSSTRLLCPCSFLITECSFHYRSIDFKAKDKELLSLHCRTKPTLGEL